MTAIQQATPPNAGEMMERVLLQGDLKSLSPTERVQYYRRVCESIGLNPLTKPFDYIVLNNKLTLYAKRDATDQLRRIHGISVTIASREQVGDLFVVTARASSKDDRTDESIGAVAVVNLKGEALANAMMKAETKAKRRVTLSIAGLGWLDETETGSVPGSRVVNVDAETGEVLDVPATGAATSEAVAPARTAEAGSGETATPAASSSRAHALARLATAYEGSGLTNDDLRTRSQEMFGKTKREELTLEELDLLAAEIEGVKMSAMRAAS